MPFEKARREAFLEAMRSGAGGVEFAALVAGVSTNTVYRWLNEGRDPKGRREHKAFARDFDQAGTTLGHEAVKALSLLAKGDSPAAVKAAEALARHYHPVFRATLDAKLALDAVALDRAKLALDVDRRALSGGGSAVIVGFEHILNSSALSDAAKDEIRKAIAEGSIKTLSKWGLGDDLGDDEAA